MHYEPIHYHLSINPLLFARIHPCFRKDKVPEEDCLFIFKAAILDTNQWQLGLTKSKTRELSKSN